MQAHGLPHASSSLTTAFCDAILKTVKSLEAGSFYVPRKGRRMSLWQLFKARKQAAFLGTPWHGKLYVILCSFLVQFPCPGSEPCSMVDIQERYALSYAGGDHVPIQPCLLHSATDGSKFLKLRPSHRTICKLVCGKNLDILRGNVNPSIAASAGLQKLKDQLLETMRASVGHKSEEAAAAFFEDASSSVPKKKKFQKLDDAPETINMVVNEQEVVFLTPSNSKTTDLVVKLEPLMLEAVLDVLAEDVESCFSSGSKRTYRKSGKFRGLKRSRSALDADESDSAAAED